MARRIEDHPEVLGVDPGLAEDKELTLAFQAGDKGAYQAIHDRHASRVHRVCRRMLGPDDAQEAAQEAFLRIYQALGRFNGRYQLGPWVTRIATNVCLDHLRARTRRPADPVPNEVLTLNETIQDEDSEPERMVIRNSESRHVRKVLAKLPPMHRAAIVLRDFEGLSYAEIAIALQITECQSKALIHRARQNFKRSWTSSLSALLPWRLIERLRGIEGSARDHTAEVVSAAQSVTSCAGMLQQCGQYVGQHVATVVTVALVGTVAGATSHAATRTATPEPTAVGYTISADTLSSPSHKVLSQIKADDVEAEASETKAPVAPPEPESSVPTPTPTAEPAPSPAPTPTETPDPSASSSPQPSETPRPSPPPQPFAPAVGFDYGRPVTARIPRSHTASVSCSKDVLEQRLETVVDDDDSGATYPALLELHWNGATSSDLSLELTVWKNGTELYYSGTGSLTDGSYPEGQRKLSFVGDYGTSNGAARSMDLPSSGRFTAGLTLDCAALSVITESVVLGA